jgi:hypothetical protein
VPIVAAAGLHVETGEHESQGSDADHAQAEKWQGRKVSGNAGSGVVHLKQSRDRLKHEEPSGSLLDRSNGEGAEADEKKPGTSCR